MPRYLLVVPILLALLTCSPGEGTHHVNERSLRFEPIPGTTTDRRWGVHQHAGYRMEVPEAWNGELVLFAHGYGGGGYDLRVADPPIREHLVRQGFAWAASSFRRNGYAAEDGVEDTEALRRLFARRFRAPERTYLLGESMGGHIAAAGIERRPRTYDGVLSYCGVLGDVELFDFYLDHAVVAAALSGIEASHPPPDDYRTKVVPAIEAALGYGPGRELDQKGRQLSTATELMSGGERPLFAEGFGYWSGTETAIDGHPFLLAAYGGAFHPGTGEDRPVVEDNTDAVYRLGTDPQQSEAEARLNADVLRVARRDPFPFPVVRGEPPVNVLALQVVGDLFVPLSMVQVYAAEAATHGLADRLVVRVIRDLAHCGVSVAELEMGFDDLVAWVREGRRPAGDDVLDAAAVARPDFGCRFTIDVRPDLPPCPSSPSP